MFLSRDQVRVNGGSNFRFPGQSWVPKLVPIYKVVVLFVCLFACQILIWLIVKYKQKRFSRSGRKYKGSIKGLHDQVANIKGV